MIGKTIFKVLRPEISDVSRTCRCAASSVDISPPAKTHGRGEFVAAVGEHVQMYRDIALVEPARHVAATARSW
jgi:hypothetical protein